MRNRRIFCAVLMAVMLLSCAAGCRNNAGDDTVHNDGTSKSADTSDVTDDTGNVEKITSKTEDGKTVELVTEISTNKQGETQISTKWVDHNGNSDSQGNNTDEHDGPDGSAAANTTAANANSDPEAAWRKPYDIEQIRADCREYAESMGMVWDDSLNVDKEHWVTPTSTDVDWDKVGHTMQEDFFDSISWYKQNGYNSINVIILPATGESWINEYLPNGKSGEYYVFFRVA